MREPTRYRGEWPQRCLDSDKDFIGDQLLMLPVMAQFKAREGYSRIFEAAYDAEPIEYKKENAGRRAANIRLRVFVQRNARYAAGLVDSPYI